MSEPAKEVRVEITTGTIAKAILLVVTAIVLYVLKDVVLVVLTAVVIASAIEPPILWLIKKGVPRIFSALIMYAVLAGVLIGSFYTFVPRLLEDTSEFLGSVPQYLESASLWNPLDEKTSAKSEQVTSVAQGLAQSSRSLGAGEEEFSLKGAIAGINDAINAVSAGFVHSASSIFGGVLSFILIAVLSFYLAVQEDGIEKFLRAVIPAKKEDYVVNLWKRTQAKIGRWMQGQLVLALLVGAMVYLGLMVLGVKNALLFAALAAFLETIPLFGPIIAAVPAVATAYNDGGASAGFIVAGLYLVIHQFENHLIYPMVVKKIVGIPPIVVILALLVGLKLAGFLGIVLSVPAASLLLEFIDDMERQRRTTRA
jgi:predicted PurR-regulated permease PerM